MEDIGNKILNTVLIQSERARILMEQTCLVMPWTLKSQRKKENLLDRGCIDREWGKVWVETRRLDL